MKVTKIETVETTSPEMKEEAFGIVKGADGQWKLVSVNYDLVTKTSGNVKVLRDDGDRGTIIEQFKIVVANALLS